MNNLEKAKELYDKLNKSVDGPFLDIPAAVDASESDRLRAKEGTESIYDFERHNQEVISLSRVLMSVDTKYYGINRKTATRIVEYIERNEDTVLPEIVHEFNIKIKDYYDKVRLISKIKETDFATKDDYERALNFQRKKLVDFENKINYIAELIKILKSYKEDGDVLNQEKDSGLMDKFDFSYIYSFFNEGYPFQ